MKSLRKLIRMRTVTLKTLLKIFKIKIEPLKSDELEATNKMLSVNNKNLEIKVVKVPNENKDFKKVVTNVKT